MQFLPNPTMLYGHDIAVGDVILDSDPYGTWIEAFLVEEVTMEPDPVAVVGVRGRLVLALEGEVRTMTNTPRWFGKRSRQPVASTMFDCTADW